MNDSFQLENRVLARIFRYACAKQQSPKFCLSRISYLSTSNPCINYILMPIELFSHVVEDALLGTCLFITPPTCPKAGRVLTKSLLETSLFY